MKHILLFVLPFLFFLSCKKDKDNNVAHSFNIHGISDVHLEPGDLRVLELEIKHVSGAQNNVSLEISGMPAGVTAKFSTSKGIPDFATVLTITTSEDVVAGVYPLVITCSDGSVAKDYEFSLHVRDCMKKLTGSKKGMDICPSGNLSYDAQIVWVSGMDSRIYIAGFGGFESGYIYADLDCETGVITIPKQRMEGYYYGEFEIIGSGTFYNGKIEVTYTYTNLTDPEQSETCTTVIQ